MKKDRNSFFSQYGYTGYNTNPNMGAYMPMMNNTQDIESRLNQIERELDRLEARISKLENLSNSTNTDINFANSMYMV